MPRVIFHNVTIAVEAESDVEAYRLLDERLGAAPFEYQSDTYTDDMHDDRNTGYIGKEQNEYGEDEFAIFVGTLDVGRHRNKPPKRSD
jgi:hypothetical protein